MNTLVLLGCPDCPTNLAARSWAAGDLLPVLGMLLLPLAVMGAVMVVVGLKRPLLGAAMLLGVGLGGFLDGIVLHQVLQWHNMLSSRVPPDDLVSMKYNMVFDGVFHLVTWLATVVGLALLYRSARHGDLEGRPLVAGLLGGWGLFNFTEGLFDHQVFGLHHVHPGAGQLAWDLLYLASGPVLGIIAALLLVQRNVHVPRLRSYP
jgi:uncharacterized membrane protein